MKPSLRSILTGISYTLCTHLAAWGAFLLFYLGLRQDEASFFATVIILCISIGVYFLLQRKNSKPLFCLLSAGITHLLLYIGEGTLISLIDKAGLWHIWDPIGTVYLKGLSYGVIALVIGGGLLFVLAADAIRIGVLRYKAGKRQMEAVK